MASASYDSGDLNRLRIDISAQAINDNEKYKKEKMKEIMSTFCALINSHGGRLKLNFKSHSLTESDRRNLIRSIEERLSDVLGYSKMRDIIKSVPFGHRDFVFDVENVSGLCTLNYNLYISTETQVLAIPPKTPVADIKEILGIKGHIVEVKDVVTLGTHYKKFVFQQSISSQSRESKTVQFKCLKAEKSKCVSLGDRITNKSNKFTRYVSAFANHRGGHIYYGVDDDGEVKGEHVKNKKKVIERVRKAINGKMVWPIEEGPKRGEQWEIFFEPVKDSNDIILPFFVIVIWVAYCPGGVFTEEPESYHIVEGKIGKMDFKEWSLRISLTPVMRRFARSQWKSVGTKRIFYSTIDKVHWLRNMGDVDTVKYFVRKIRHEYSNSHPEILLGVFSEMAVFASRRSEHVDAGDYIAKYVKLFCEVQSSLLFRCLGMFIKSMKQCSEGNGDKSTFVHDALGILQFIPAGLCSSWFYLHVTSLLVILAMSPKTTPEDRNYKFVLAKTCCARALEDSRPISGEFQSAVDAQQSSFIHLASLYLTCSLNGTIDLKAVVRHQDIVSAINCLRMVDELILERYALSHLRQVQYLMVKSSLALRQSQLPDVTVQPRRYLLESSLRNADDALKLAIDCEFWELVGYCGQQKACVTEQIVRNGVRNLVRR